jgi:hypothetical protein
MFDMNDAKDINHLNQILNRQGIHFERNMFGQPYVILDHTFFQMMVMATKKSCSKEKDNRISSTRTV